MKKEQTQENKGISEAEQKLLRANDEIALNKSFIAAMIAENDSLLSTNKRLLNENKKLQAQIVELESKVII